MGTIIDGFAPNGVVGDLTRLLETLDRYAEAIQPWAASAATKMIVDVGRRTDRMWRRVSKEIGVALREEVQTSSQGQVMRDLLQENVVLIQSLPVEAGQRVHRLTTEALTSGRRAESIAQEIMRSEHVTKSRARLIARTEVSRTNALLVQARAMKAGSQGYIWRTSRDDDVRPTHKKMEGVYVPWDDPPKTDASLEPYHAGCGPNCRCYAEPVFPNL